MSEWISVKERLPQEGQKVLCCFTEYGMQVAKYVFDWGDYYVWDCMADNFSLNSVTHWQPLPEPPKN